MLEVPEVAVAFPGIIPNLEVLQAGQRLKGHPVQALQAIGPEGEGAQSRQVVKDARRDLGQAVDGEIQLAQQGRVLEQVLVQGPDAVVPQLELCEVPQVTEDVLRELVQEVVG